MEDWRGLVDGSACYVFFPFFSFSSFLFLSTLRLPFSLSLFPSATVQQHAPLLWYTTTHGRPALLPSPSLSVLYLTRFFPVVSSALLFLFFRFLISFTLETRVAVYTQWPMTLLVSLRVPGNPPGDSLKICKTSQMLCLFLSNMMHSIPIFSSFSSSFSFSLVFFLFHQRAPTSFICFI